MKEVFTKTLAVSLNNPSLQLAPFSPSFSSYDGLVLVPLSPQIFQCRWIRFPIASKAPPWTDAASWAQDAPVHRMLGHQDMPPGPGYCLGISLSPCLAGCPGIRASFFSWQGPSSSHTLGTIPLLPSPSHGPSLWLCSSWLHLQPCCSALPQHSLLCLVFSELFIKVQLHQKTSLSNAKLYRLSSWSFSPSLFLNP